MQRIVLIDEDFFGVSFPYDASVVDRLKKLTNRRWNPDERQWEIHLVHLPEVMVILRLNQAMLPPNLKKVFADKWQGIDAVLRLGNDRTVLSGGNIPLEALDEEISYWKQGAEHTRKYKEGKWDGMRRLFDRRSSSFPTGLLSRVLKVLDRHKTRYRIDDLREENSETVKMKKPALSKLRDYQKEALETALKGGRGILEMATGSGKTVVAAHIIGHLKKTCLFFVHTKDLLYQTKNMLGEILGIPIGQIGDGVVDIQQVTVGTVQTCSRALGITLSGANSEVEEEEEESLEDQEPDIGQEKVESISNLLNSVSVVFFDECHHVPANTCFLLTMNLPRANHRFGLSATPYRSDRQDLLIEAGIGAKLISINASSLIEKKHLVPPHITFFVMSQPQENKTRTYHQVYQAEVVENETRNNLVAQITQKFASQGKTVLILVTQVKHGAKIAALLPEAIFLTGKDASSTRNAALDGLRNREIPVVIATTLADEGLDIPSLDVLVLAGAGKSETRALQRIGRALRPVKGKKIAFVIDFFDQVRFLNEHSKKRLEIYETEQCFQLELVNPWTGNVLNRTEASSSENGTTPKTSATSDAPRRRASRPGVGH